MSSSSVRHRALIAAPILALLGGIAATSAAAAATPTYYAFGGYGYGSSAKLGSLVSSGPTSKVDMCTTNAVSDSNSAAGVKLGTVGTVGAVQTSTRGTSSSGTLTSTTTTTTGAVSLLTGLVQAKAITTQAVAKHTSSGFSQTGSTKITDLKIAGLSMSATPAKNTKVTLPLKLGEVILNHQSTSTKYGLHQITVDAMYITVNSGNLLNLPAGKVVVGHSVASLHDAVHARPYGSAYVSQVQIANGTVTSGQTALSDLPCAGSGGATVSNTTAGVSLANLLTVGAAGSTAVSTDSATSTTARTSASVANVSLLGGKVKVKALKVQAAATKLPGKTLTTSSSGTAITGLTINGKSVTVSTKENTTVNIAGIGTLYLHRTVRSGTRVQVFGLQLKLLTDQLGGKAGTTITVGFAGAGVSTR